MNKNITLLLIGSLLLAALGFMTLSGSNNHYSPRVQAATTADGQFEYLKMIRSNVETGIVSPEDIAKVRSQIAFERSARNKAEWPLEWEFSGPDNAGGRTRCLVIDKNDPNILYTGGVSGMVFKSSNKGGSWRALTMGDDNFGIVSMAQLDDGSILYGTGEDGFVGGNGTEDNGGFDGTGIYKSTDGETFSLLPTTTNFGYVSMLTKHPTQNLIFAGAASGLKYSDDGGTTWKNIRGGNCRDIQFNSEGTVLVTLNTTIYRSTTPTDGNSYSAITDIPSAGNTRVGVAWSMTDPNYCYAVTVGNVSAAGLVPAASAGSGLTGFYKSTDKGLSWTKEVNRSSRFFAPFSNIGLNTQGYYDLAIAVHPTDKDRVFIGGIEFAEWTDAEGPEIVGSKFGGPTSPFRIHSDKHLIKFDTSGSIPIMYVCTDGGIYRSTNEELNNYKEINVGLTTTQFYGLAASRTGRIVGGTQDQRTMLISKESFPRKIGVEVIGGDGFQAEFSEYDPNIVFAESYNSLMQRSTVGGTEMAPIWDNRIEQAFVSATQPSSIFNARMELWEDPVLVARIKDSADFFSDEERLKMDSMMESRFFLCMNDGIYMCNNALKTAFNEDDPSDDDTRWFRVSNVTSVGDMHASKDGNSLFIGRRGRVYRVDGFNSVQFDTVNIPGYNDIDPGLTTTDISASLSIGSRFVTGIEVDPNDPNRVVVTVGNYGYSSYVYITNNAMDANPTWTSIQGNLPQFPVYHAVINVDDPDMIILGTEFGMWVTQNGTNSTPTWVESLTGVDPNIPFPKVPVFTVYQVEDRPWSGPKIYAGTYGMGIWETGSLLSNVKRPSKSASRTLLNAYPNPANNFVNLNTEIKGTYTATIYNLNGQAVISSSGVSNGLIKLNTSQLLSGNY
ncbi:MAG: T9SS type A sorting domain-containing protein, partial [Bacteroidia bacterium]|nr:T9SS type A sorting domain-containing protein [Bacteroidia bacterium]